ncbi:MAG: hypothetical protein DMF63_18375 [Acidobacteria bacterium]|nr:MAG: hypothetical protein DMF63_18375 [Acidobacteriota bacterium]
MRISVLFALTVLVITTSSASANVHARFSLDSPSGGPFPSDRYTTIDPTQNTGLRIDLPKRDCSVRRSDCEDIDLLNTLDGFNMQPRLSIPFDGPIDVDTVSSSTVFLISLGDTLDLRDGGGRRVGIDQIVWDALTNTLHLQTDELLEQHTRYALIVTSGLRDESGAPVEASESFRRFRRGLNFGQSEGNLELKNYRKQVLDALKAAREVGVPENQIVTASAFTTQSATAMLEKIRDQIKAGTPDSANFNLGPASSRTVFQLDRMTGMTWNQQRTANSAPLTPVAVSPALLRLIPGAVGQVAFGKYSSPDYTVHPGEHIPPIGTRSGTPIVQSFSDVYFNLYLPSGPKPAGGWPVAIIGHGSGSNKNNVGANVAASFAAQGIATIAINEMGHGFGPNGTMTVSQTDSPSVTFTEGGRGIDQNADGIIESREGDEVQSPRMLQLNRDGLIRTLGDFMQLVRVIDVGMDVDGDGARDLDPSRIYYFGASLGGIYATVLAAVDPQISATVANVAGGSLIENRRLFAGPDSFRSRLAALFAARQPSLINGPGINRIAGVAIPGPGFFNENMPLRSGVSMAVGFTDGTSGIIHSPVINTTPGSSELQEWFDRAAWVAQSANPVAFAPHLRKRPLAGVPTRPVLFTFAKGDQSMPNPSTTAILRAGDLADRTVLYRHDLAYAELPGLPKDPHLFTVGTGMVPFRPIALEAQRQSAIFFASNGTNIIQPSPARYFEVPIQTTLPESLDYIP